MLSTRLPSALLARLLGGLTLLCAGGIVTAQEAPPGGGQPPPGQPPDERRDEGPTNVTIGEPVPYLRAQQWENVSGTPTLAGFRSRIVLIFCFDTISAADSIDIMNAAHTKFGSAGVVIIGLTKQKKEQAEGVIKGKEVKFIVGYEADTDRYRIPGPPWVLMLDTGGRLTDQFHPGFDLEGKVRAQMRRTPPEGTDEQSLRNRIRKVREFMLRKDLGRAYTQTKALEKLVTKEDTLGKEVNELLKEILEASKKWLEEAQESIRANNQDDAIRILSQISVRFEGEAVRGEAETEIGKIMGDARLRPKMRSALDNVRGEILNDEAGDHEASRRYIEALRLYRRAAEEYTGSDAAKAAEEAIDRINNDPEALSAITKLRAEEEADRWLDLANRFARIEMYTRARELYDRILDTHPDTQAASRARERLAKLPEEPEEEEEVTPLELPEDEDEQ